MADNTVRNATSGGDTIATDDITKSGSVAENAKVQRIKVGYGVDGDYIDVSTAKPLPTTDLSTSLAVGEVPGSVLRRAKGVNPQLDNSASFETLWDGSVLYVPPTQARTHQLVSTSASDTGSVVSSGTATGGTTSTLVDTTATFIADGVAVLDHVLNDTAQSVASITAVTSETTLTFANFARDPETGRALAATVASDAYRIVTGTSTGSSWVLVVGLDGSLLDKTEFVVLNGVSNVPTVNTYLRVNFMRAFGDAGSEGAVGVLTLTADTDATISGQICNGNNQSLSGFYTIPLGKKGLLLRWWGAISSKTGATVQIQILGGKLDLYGYFLDARSLQSQGTSTFEFSLGPEFVPPGTDIWMEVSSDTNNVSVIGGFDVVTSTE